jgi:hypothetical protein
VSDYAGGWHIRQVYLADGRAVIVNPTPKNLTWCRRMVKVLTDDHDVGDYSYSVEPGSGWAALDDPVMAILCHVATGDVSPDVALAEIRRLTAQGEAGDISTEI